MGRPLNVVIVVIAALGATACFDPVHDDAVAALGPEVDGVPTGPSHRPGQPCMVCHGGEGPGHPTFSLAGTVYLDENGTEPVANALVRVVGADGLVFEARTNCVGTFYAEEGNFSLIFPAGAAVTTSGGARVMLSETHRSGNCNDCHRSGVSRSSPGRVWVSPKQGGGCTGDCPGGSVTSLPACDHTPPTCTTTPSYANDAAAILAARCVPCHSATGQAKVKDFSTYAGIKDHDLYKTAQTQILKCQMPPPPLPALTGAERDTLLCWLSQGAAQN